MAYNPTRSGSTPQQWRDYTQLIISRANLFEKIRNHVDFSVARSLDLGSKSERVKSGKYYKFHKDHSRLTDHCREFWAYVERLIRDGELGNYVKGP